MLLEFVHIMSFQTLLRQEDQPKQVYSPGGL